MVVIYNVFDFLCCLFFFLEYGVLNFLMVVFIDSGYINKIILGSELLVVGIKLFIKVEVRLSIEELDLLLERCYVIFLMNREDSN